LVEVVHLAQRKYAEKLTGFSWENMSVSSALIDGVPTARAKINAAM
jgi:hypothetical protein